MRKYPLSVPVRRIFRHTMKKFLLLTALAAATMNADIISFSASTSNFNSSAANFLGAGTGSAQSFGNTISFFDASWGTLNSITVTIETYMKWDGTYTNQEAVNNSITYAFSSLPTVQVVGAGFISAVTHTGSGANFPVGVGTVVGPNGTFDPAQSTEISLVNQNPGFANFIGVGNFGNIFTATPSFAFGGTSSGDLSRTDLSRFGARITVAYDYTPNQTGNEVPEPSTMALIGSALVGVSFIARRRK